MNDGGLRPQLCALRGARSRENTTHGLTTSIPRAALRGENNRRTWSVRLIRPALWFFFSLHLSHFGGGRIEHGSTVNVSDSGSLTPPVEVFVSGTWELV